MGLLQRVAYFTAGAGATAYAINYTVVSVKNQPADVYSKLKELQADMPGSRPLPPLAAGTQGPMVVTIPGLESAKALWNGSVTAVRDGVLKAAQKVRQ